MSFQACPLAPDVAQAVGLAVQALAASLVDLIAALALFAAPQAFAQAWNCAQAAGLVVAMIVASLAASQAFVQAVANLAAKALVVEQVAAQVVVAVAPAPSRTSSSGNKGFGRWFDFRSCNKTSCFSPPLSIC